jgi:hypothetical protein
MNLWNFTYNNGEEMSLRGYLWEVKNQYCWGTNTEIEHVWIEFNDFRWVDENCSLEVYTRWRHEWVFLEEKCKQASECPALFREDIIKKFRLNAYKFHVLESLSARVGSA